MTTILASLDSPLSASLTFDDTSPWPEETLEALEKSGTVKRGENAQSVTCDGCGEGCVEDVESCCENDGTLAVYVVCRERSDIGRVRIAPERLRTWEVSFGGLARLLADAIGSQPEELTPNRLWMLGSLEIGGARTDVLLARGLRWPDGNKIIREARGRRRSHSAVLLVPTSSSLADSFEVVPLVDVLSLCGDGLSVDVSAIRNAAERAQEASALASLGRQEGNVFRREGQQWCVVYGGKRISLNHSDGATYIAYLLEHPNTPVHVRELYAIAHPPSRPEQINSCAEMDSEELAEQGVYPEGGYSPTDKHDDAELFATYRKARVDLQIELEKARRAGNSDEADELQKQLDNLNRVMSAEFGLDGGPRKPGDPNKQAYDRVSKAINAAKKTIEKHHKPLFAHLASIRYDTYTYTYSPEPPIAWKV